MKIDISNKKKLILSVSLAAAALVAVVGGTLAIYTSQVFQRGVVRNRDNQTVRFSSDKLAQVSVGDPPPISYYPVAEKQTSLTFHICNYDQTKSTLVSERDISYIIDFTVEGGTSGFSYPVSYNGGDSESLDAVTGSTHTLVGGRLSVDTYTVTFLEADYQNLKLTVTATPLDTTLTRNTILTATLIPIAYGTTQNFNVSFEFPDSRRVKEDGSLFTPTDLDAYNVLVTAAGGEGEVYICWDPQNVEMDYFFLKNLSPETDGTWRKIRLRMNSADETASYLIPFYNPNGEKPNWSGWQSLAAYIEVGVVENP